MGDSSRDRRISVLLPRTSLGRPGLSVDTTYAVRPESSSRESDGPPTTTPPSPRTFGPRRPTPFGSEYLIVPRRRT